MRNFVTYAALSITSKQGAFWFVLLFRTMDKEIGAVQLKSEAATSKAQIGRRRLNDIVSSETAYWLVACV
jgi:hypothetical protein